MRKLLLLTMLATALNSSGCASIAVTDQALVERTSFALGIAKEDFTISNRVDEGAASRYVVRTKAGQTYRCLVGGSIGLLGRAVSDAVCTKDGDATRNPLLGR